jgi:geranylgeranyl reductase family protein
VSHIVDAVVVGAGPGGATAAAKLAEEGLDVLLLEKASPPRDKPCGGGLSPKAYRLLDVDINDLVLARPSRLTLSSPGARPVGLASRAGAIWMVQRSAFDQRLVEHAQGVGARLLTNVTVRSVKPGGADGLAEVETDTGILRARVVVGADGADSVVARTAGLRSARDRHYTLALEVEALRSRRAADAEALIDFALPRGYAWLFPKGDIANVGVGTDDRRQFRMLRQHLSRFIARHSLAFDGEARAVGHKIPVWTGHELLHRRNVILVGDAAGVADPFFGEGIAYAIQTGRFAATATARFCAGDWPDLEGYTRSVQEVLGRDLLFWSILGRVVYRAPGLAIRLLAASSRFQSLADAAISGDKSFSKTWRRAPVTT